MTTKINYKLSKNPKDAARGVSNKYYTQVCENGNWTLVDYWTREVQSNLHVCEFQLVQNTDTKESILLASTLGAQGWIGEKIDVETCKKMSWEQMDSYIFNK